MGQKIAKAAFGPCRHGTRSAEGSDLHSVGTRCSALRVCRWRSQKIQCMQVVEPQAGPLFEVGVAEMNGWRPTMEDTRRAAHKNSFPQRRESER